MEMAILGLAQSGKSTLFDIMTGVKSADHHGERCVRGQARVPDARFDRLVEIFKPKKVSPASVPFTDVGVAGEDAWREMRSALAGADGFLHIVDGFMTSDVPEMIKSYRKLADELIISDLIAVENRLEKLAKLPKAAYKQEEIIHAACLPRCKEALDAGRPLRELTFSENELTGLRSFSFWSIRPELVVLNLAEESLALAETFSAEADISSPVIGICGQVEQEIAQLDANERAPFLESLGIEEPAFERVIRRAFTLLGRISYFTVGEDEVKAWVIPTDSTAPRAAAAIHKDFERGFIKAEVVSYDDFIAHGETLAGAKSAGRLRLEGKDYIVQDGDIISFRFNV